MTLTTSLPALAVPTAVPPTAVAQSGLTLPISLPLSSLRAAALAWLPDTLVTVDQTQTLAGGLVTVHLTGDVRRSGELTLTPDGDGLRLSLPVTAHIRATPVNLGDVLARDFSGSAILTAHVTPVIGTDWNAGVKVQTDYRWTAPLSFELMKGVSINVGPLVDPGLRLRMGSVSQTLGDALRRGLKLRERATELWGRLGQPWALPGVQDGYALIRPQGLSVTPVQFGSDRAEVMLGGSFVVLAGLGRVPGPTAPSPLPPLRLGLPQGRGVRLEVPLTLAYPPLSALATRSARAQTYTLPLPLSPRLSVQNIELSSPSANRLNAAVQLSVRALGLSIGATVDVSGVPKLEGQTLTLQDVTVRTRPSSVGDRVLGWLADRRVQALLAKQARFDLAPELKRAQQALQAHLPYRVAGGVTLAGQVGPLALKSVGVGPQGVTAVTQAQGELEAQVDLGK